MNRTAFCVGGTALFLGLHSFPATTTNPGLGGAYSSQLLAVHSNLSLHFCNINPSPFKMHKQTHTQKKKKREREKAGRVPVAMHEGNKAKQTKGNPN